MNRSWYLTSCRSRCPYYRLLLPNTPQVRAFPYEALVYSKQNCDAEIRYWFLSPTAQNTRRRRSGIIWNYKKRETSQPIISFRSPSTTWSSLFYASYPPSFTSEASLAALLALHLQITLIVRGHSPWQRRCLSDFTLVMFTISILSLAAAATQARAREILIFAILSITASWA